MSGSLTSFPNNSEWRFYNDYLKNANIFAQQIFGKTAFKVWTEMGKKQLKNQYIILYNEGLEIFSFFAMSTRTQGNKNVYSFSNYVEFNDEAGLGTYINENNISNICFCSREEVGKKLCINSIERFIDITDCKQNFQELIAQRPKLTMKIGDNQIRPILSFVAVVVCKDCFETSIFNEYSATWKDLLGDVINNKDHIVVTLNVLYDGFGNILLQAKTKDKMFNLSLPAEQIIPTKMGKSTMQSKKGKFEQPGTTLAPHLNVKGKAYIQQPTINRRKALDISITEIITKHLGKEVLWDENLDNKTLFELQSIQKALNEALCFDFYYIDTNIFIDNFHEQIIEHIRPICEENTAEFLIHKLVYDELENQKKGRINPKTGVIDEDLKDKARLAVDYINRNTIIDSPIQLHVPEMDEEYKEIINRQDKNNIADDGILLAARKNYRDQKKVLIISTDGGLKTRLGGTIKQWEQQIKRIGGKAIIENRPKAIFGWQLIKFIKYYNDVNTLIKQKQTISDPK